MTLTCAECQDLLLDLAYGELDAPRGAAVQEHARGCAACAASLSELASTRRMVAPLGELEEPPDTLDAKVLDAARTEAVILGGGTQGPVIDADVRVQPLAVEAAQIDARARVQAPARKGRSRRLVRAAFAGAMAAAAGLALLVSSGGGKKAVPRSDDAEYRIQVRTADEARREAAASRTAAAPAPAKGAPPPVSPAAAAANSAPPAATPATPAAPAVPPPAPTLTTPTRPDAPAARAGEDRAAAKASRPAPAAGRVGAGDDESATSSHRPQEPAAAEVAESGARAEAPPAAQVPARVAEAPAAAQGRSRVAQAPLAADPAALERRAEATRRQGGFAAAAGLYQEAARARASANDAASAGWDLAHAVECLAAAGRFGEARAAEVELRTLYPGAAGAQAAASRALRTAPQGGDAPAADRAPPR